MSVVKIEKSIALKDRQYKMIGANCIYCNSPMVEGGNGRARNIATLDHILPRSYGGCNYSDNLIVCCMSCNSSRGNMPIIKWVAIVAKKHNSSVKRIIAKIDSVLLSPIDLEVYRTIQRIRVKSGNIAAREWFNEFLAN